MDYATHARLSVMEAVEAMDVAAWARAMREVSMAEGWGRGFAPAQITVPEEFLAKIVERLPYMPGSGIRKIKEGPQAGVLTFRYVPIVADAPKPKPGKKAKKEK